MAMNDAFREAASIDRRLAQRALGKMRSPMHGRAVNSGTQKAARPKIGRTWSVGSCRLWLPANGRASVRGTCRSHEENPYIGIVRTDQIPVRERRTSCLQ